ncbi:50S ribosomal subunit protein L2 [Candidatus Nasuia deltocephalinicola]|uniref:Large ribosomal subunit protein uL2 n=1 Tax=Candidatus Nasuia deltocephalincola TaxID=1160784 RepID=A0A975A354_9PROT|nr:50S ribosomal protein L2 [Candidatus Nasuia deltocephalinicola]BEH03947.1 50S ribosomal subunit protein L2 [Candidatus Nasuia deltocephalinicola]
MNLFKFKPTSPGVRNKIKLVNNLYKYKSFKFLKKSIKFKSGRNNTGSITIRHKGGRSKRFYRYLDVFRNKINIFGIIEKIEYDPNRNSNIFLILYSDGERRYIIACKNINIGEIIISSFEAPIKIGNTLILKNIPLGTKIHCVEIKPGMGGKIARSAGCYCLLHFKSFEYVSIYLKSGLIINLNPYCRATIGEVGNSEHILIKKGKAGSKRNLGIRPTVRGVAMNPVDHPHGGGEGKTSGGRDPVSIWGKYCKSFKKKCHVL